MTMAGKNMNNIIETIRTAVRAIIVLSVLSGLGYILVVHVGDSPTMIEPLTVWSFFSGLVAGTLLNYYFKEGVK